tara:strand:- start:3790 stop:4713 length:924 start_codon:yes stop_codon:yes gene_type:complete
MASDDSPFEPTPEDLKILEAPWTEEHENILVEWADKAMCYRWLHSTSNASFSRKNAWYTIPVIVISTLTGTANFAQERVPEEYQTYYVMTVGGFNILAGIITTVQQFLKITQLNEAHRVASIAWDKFYRNIKTELAKNPKERLQVIQFLKMCKEEFDRLMETSPVIEADIINQFKIKFSKSDAFKDIIKPEICDALVSTQLARNQWYTEENQEKEKVKLLAESIHKNNDEKRVHDLNKKSVLDFKKTFFNLNNRYPIDEETINNLKTEMDVETIKELLLEIQHDETDTTGDIEVGIVGTVNDNRDSL